MNRREMLRNSLFGGLGIGLSVEMIQASNEHVAATDAFRKPKSSKPGAIAIAFGDLFGSRDLPIRPKGAVVTDGAPIYFLWPSEEHGDARVYIEFANRADVIPQKFVFRLRMGKPSAPYYLHWHRGDYYLYTAPGSLIERAGYLYRNPFSEDDIVQALSDLRQAVILNLTVIGGGQQHIDAISDLDRQVREAKSLNGFWEAYKAILTETNPSRA